MSKKSKQHTRQPIANPAQPANAPRGDKGSIPKKSGEPEAPGEGDLDDDDNRITQRNPAQRPDVDAETPA